MELTFIFTKMQLDEPEALKRGYRKSFELPDTAAQHPSFRERVMDVAHAVDALTDCFLFLTCLPLGLKDYLISQRTELTSYRYSFRAIVQRFERRRGSKFIRFVVLEPNHFLFDKYSQPYFSLIKDLNKLSERAEHQSYFSHLNTVIDNLLFLLNIEDEGKWVDGGFMPNWVDESAKATENKRIGRYVAQQNKATRLKEKLTARQQQQLEKSITSSPEPKTGAGRTIGARPGIYKGVQMRSQLEIRFAAELDERGIRWIYEGEALGDASYLVDFYLPDLGVWIEIKGKLEARDRQVLPDVAKTLKAERKQRLLMYTSSGPCFVINPSGFREVERKKFWNEVAR